MGTIQLEVTLAGGVRLHGPGADLVDDAVGPPRVRLALGLLVLERHRRVTRDELAEVLWPEHLPPSWQSALRTTVSRVRTAVGRALGLPDDPIVHGSGAYRLVLPATVGVGVDVEAVEAQLDEAVALAAAGDHLAAIDAATVARGVAALTLLPGADGPWLDARRAQLHAQHLRSLELLAESRLASGSPVAAAAAAAEASELDPYHERAHRLVIAAHAAAGSRAEALRAYERCRRRLAEDLGVAPAPETEALYRSLLGDEPTLRPVLPGSLALVGRDQPLARLTALLDATCDGRGGIAVVAGEPGIGKSRLAREASVVASGLGMATAWGTCLEPEWSPPFGAIADVAHQLGAGDLVAALRGDRPVPAGDHGVRERARRVLLDMADDRPLLVVLDDLHWADAGTIGVLRSVAADLPRTALAIVGTFRPTAVDAGHPLADALAAISRDPGADRVDLQALDLAASGALLDQVRPGMSSATVETLRSASGGNPFFLESLARHLSAGHLDLNHLPSEVRDVVAARVARLPEAARRLLEAGAGFDGPFPLTVAAAVAGLSDEEAVEAVEAAMSADLVAPAAVDDSYGFAHALVRRTLSGALGPSRRVRLHRRIAEELRRIAGDDPRPWLCDELAGQYHRSASLPGGHEGAAFAERAAAHAESTGAHDKAATFWGMALDLRPPSDPERTRLQIRRALALLAARSFDEGSSALLAAAAELERAEGPGAAAALIADGAWSAELAGGSDAAFSLAAAGLAVIEPSQRDDVWARLLILDIRRQEADAPGPAAPIHPPERQRAAALLRADPRFRYDLYWAVFDSRQELLDAGDDDHQLLLQWAGEYRRALPLFQRQANADEARGRLAHAVNAWSGAARAAAALGHLDDATDMCAHAADVTRRIDLRGAFALSLLGAKDEIVHARDDGYDELGTWNAHLAGAQRDRAQRWAGPTIRAAGARITALLGAGAPSLDDLPTLLPILEATPARAVANARAVSDVVAAVFLVGGHPLAPRLEAVVRDKVLGPDFRAPMSDGRLDLARLCVVTDRPDEANRWFDEADVVLEQIGARPLRAIAQLDRAVGAQRIGEIAEARVFAAVAAEQFAALGMVGWIRRADRLLAELALRTA